MNVSANRIRRVVAAVGLSSAISGAAIASVPNTPVLDGRPLEYEADELIGSYTGAPTWGPNNVMSNLYVTWNSNSLYVCLHGFSRPPENNKIAVLIDVDPGNGTGATTTTNWVNTGEGAIDFNDVSWEALGTTAFGMDYMVASEGAFNNVLRAEYDGIATPVLGTNVIALFDTDNGANPTGGDLDMATREEEGTGCNLLAMEACIPWTTLYDTSVTNGAGLPRFGDVGPGSVPTGATLRVIAFLHNNNGSDPFNNPDVIPAQVSPGTSYSGGFQIADDYIDVIVDANNDGIPDGIGAGDTTGPWIKNAVGAEGSTTLLLQFDEELDGGFVGTPGNFRVNGTPAVNATLDAPTLVRITTGTALPSGASASIVTVSNATDTALNVRTPGAERCFFPSSGGITNDVQVTFILNTDSGMGQLAGVSAFFINGGAFPLEFGFPPAQSTPLTQVGATPVYTAQVTFVAGTPSTFSYKYSALLSNGTNNYEAVRLADYENVSRPITLPTDGSPLVISNDLGAAAGPLRTGDTGYDALYADARRGDAGVRSRHTILFQLDLAGRALPANKRVVVQGSDPLRGFNSSAIGQGDFASDGLVGWTTGGVELVDDGTNGDLTPGDGIFSRLWSATDDGFDATLLAGEGAPFGLVGGSFVTTPYFGSTSWAHNRSPRSFIYKFYVKDLDTGDNDFLESPSANLEYYIADDAPANIVLDPFVWEGSSPPFLTEVNPATIVSVDRLTSNELELVITNIPQAVENTLEFTDDLVPGVFHNYGQVAEGSDGMFTARVSGVDNPIEAIRVRTPGYDGDFAWWEPNPLPPTGGVLRVYFNQNGKNTAGANPVYWYGAFSPGFGAAFTALPMTFDGQGQWHIDLNVPSNNNGHVQFLFIDTDGFVAGTTREDKNRRVDGSEPGTLGGDYSCMLGGRASWSPDPVQPGQDLTITYDKRGGNLANSPDINVWLDFDGWEELRPWDGANFETAMTQTVDTNIYTVTIPVPVDTEISVNWVFKEAPLGTSAGQQFDGNPAPETGSGRDWNAFVRP